MCPQLPALAGLVFGAAAAAQPTALTYQGRLKDGGQPASGLHDFRFRLFDAAQGGNQVGEAQCVNNITVAGGLFTASIDFGQQFASPGQRFLEIQVREDTGLGCNNGGGFVTLSPRQPLTQAPRASHANSAFALDAADGGPANAVFVSGDGEVGIGTMAPSVPLHIASDAESVLVLQDTGPNNTQSGYLGFWNGDLSETGWMGFGTPGSPHMTVLNRRAGGNLFLAANNTIGLTLASTGRIGIGTTDPVSTLDVRGDIRLGTAGQYRATAGEEALRIVRGAVDTHPFDGCDGIPTVTAGSGFSVERKDCGRYTITFDTPFQGTPVVVASGIPVGGCPPVATTSNPSSTQVSIQVSCGDSEIGAAVWPFSFIAIGPR
jgi:hypothetical protein